LIIIPQFCFVLLTRCFVEWEPAGEWKVQVTDETDREGWTYAFTFYNGFGKTPSTTCFVRRRKWVKTKKEMTPKKLIMCSFDAFHLSQIRPIRFMEIPEVFEPAELFKPASGKFVIKSNNLQFFSQKKKTKTKRQQSDQITSVLECRKIKGDSKFSFWRAILPLCFFFFFLV
jgi:hypothetical protein